MKDALLLFTKNLIAGKVKTRLAATIGNDAAMHVYKQLVQHTCNTSKTIKSTKIVFYSDFVDQQDLWSPVDFEKAIQSRGELGERMQQAFDQTFKKDFHRVLIMGTDCPGISESIINNAFAALNTVDVVIGPAEDGGYYLLGMKQVHPILFEGISWSTSLVLEQTINGCQKQNLTYQLLDLLADVDEEKDLKHMKHIVA